jgi:hypothetical protein
MGIFTSYAKHQVLVCKPCAHAVAPLHLVSYVRSLHAYEACRNARLDFAKFRLHKAAEHTAESLKEKYSLLDPRTQAVPLPLHTDPPLPDSKLYLGYCTSAVAATLQSFTPHLATDC